MATTEADVCNMALARCGQRQLIGSLSEASASAQLCNVFYRDARDATLANLDWGFARRRAVLPLATVEREGWDYVYVLPSDCIAVRRVTTGYRYPTSDVRVSYSLEYEPTLGRVMLCDETNAELVYTARVELVSRFSPSFVDVLAWRLAMDLALSLPVKPQLAMALESKYRAALLEAMALDLNQAQEDIESESEFIRVR